MPKGVYQRGVEVTAEPHAHASVEIPTTGPVSREDLITQVEPHTDMTSISSKADELAFMEELVEIYLPEGGNPNDEPVVDLGVNGVHVYLRRGQNHTIKRKYLLNLATARPTTYATVEGVDRDGAKTVNLRSHVSVKYPFSVISDTKRGIEWMRQFQASR